MANLGAQMLVEWLMTPTPAEPQPVAGVTYASKIDKAETRIDWARPAKEIERQVLAFAPSPGAWFEAKGERIKLLEAKAVEGSGKPGKVLDTALTVAAGQGAIHPLKVQRAGRAALSAEELLRGFPIPKGSVLK